MKILQDTILAHEKCSYIDNLSQTTHYKIIENCSLETCSSMIERGWRRFGIMFFRPVCEHCEACESLKIDVQNYTFSKSERRILKKNQDLKIVIGHPTLTKDHLEVHEKYHTFMQAKKDWDATPSTAKHYYASFIQGHETYGYEILYLLNDTLIAIDIVDILPNGISSTYFFYDPKYEKRSLGKYSLLQQILLAKQKDLDWIYLGYYVKECNSLNYKAQYKPLYKLQGRPDDHEVDIWNLF